MGKRSAGLLMIAAVWAALSGCGGGETVTVTETKTAGTATNPIKTYKDMIDQFTTRANAINLEYRALIDQYQAGKLSNADMASQAERNKNAYEAIAIGVTDMKVPQEFQEAHKLFISGFNKWSSAFDNYSIGYKDKDDAALDKAGNLDDQAVIEVNQAVNAINQIDS